MYTNPFPKNNSKGVVMYQFLGKVGIHCHSVTLVLNFLKHTDIQMRRSVDVQR